MPPIVGLKTGNSHTQGSHIRVILQNKRPVTSHSGVQLMILETAFSLSSNCEVTEKRGLRAF